MSALALEATMHAAIVEWKEQNKTIGALQMNAQDVKDLRDLMWCNPPRYVVDDDLLSPNAGVTTFEGIPIFESWLLPRGCVFVLTPEQASATGRL